MPEVSSLHAIELIVTLYLGLTAVLGTTVIAVTATKMRRVWVGSARTVKYRDVIRRDPLAVSLIVPVYNEPDEAIGAAERLAGLAHPRLEVILVNDGSTDQTMRRLRQSLHLREALPSPSGSLPTREVLGVYRSQLWPGLIVVDKRHGGRADALNAALNVAHNPLVCVTTTSTRLYSAALLVAAQRFEADPYLTALGAPLTPRSGGTLSGAVQQLLHARNTARSTFQGKLHVLTHLSDDFAVFRRGDVIAASGYRADELSNTELLMRLRDQKWRRGEPCSVRYHVDSAGETDAPPGASRLAARWLHEHRQATRLLCQMVALRLRPPRERLSWLTVPWMAVDTLAPLAKALAMVALPSLALAGAISWSFVALASAAVAALGALHNLLLLSVEGAVPPASDPGERARSLVAAVLTELGPRPLATLVKGWGVLTAVAPAPPTPGPRP